MSFVGDHAEENKQFLDGITGGGGDDEEDDEVSLNSTDTEEDDDADDDDDTTTSASSSRPTTAGDGYDVVAQKPVADLWQRGLKL